MNVQARDQEIKREIEVNDLKKNLIERNSDINRKDKLLHDRYDQI